MAGTTMNATIVGHDQASQVLDKVGAKVKEHESVWKEAARGIGAAFAGFAAVDFLKDSVAKFAEDQQAAQALQDAFARFPKLGDSTAAAIEEISMALERKTKFAHADNEAAAATLGQFNLTGKQIEQLLPLVDDYAAKTGQSVPEAATALGRAFMGNTKALKTIGISFKATGDTGKDFATIMADLQDKVGGFAEGQGKTAAGQLAILNHQFDDIKETVGSAVLPLLVNVGKVALPVIEDIAKAVQMAATFFGELPGPIKAGVVALGGFKLIASTGVFAKLSQGVASFKQQMAFATYQTDAQGKALTRTQVAAGLAKDKMSSLGKAIAAPAGIMLATAVITDIVSSFNAWDDAAKAVKDETSQLTDQLVSDSGKWTKASQDQLEQSTAQSEVFKELVANGADYGDALSYLTGGSVKSQYAANMLSVAMAKLPPVMLQQAAQMHNVKQEAIDGATKLIAYQKAEDATTAAVGDGAGAFRKAEAASVAQYGAMARLHQLLEVGRGAITQNGKDWIAVGNSVPVSALAALHDGLSKSQQDAINAKNKADDLAKKLSGGLLPALYDTAGKARDLNSATTTLVESMDRMSGVVPSLVDTTRDWKQALADAAKAAQDTKGKTHMLGASVLDARGDFNLATQSGRDLSTRLEDLQSKAAGMAASAGQAAGATGGVAAANRAARQSLIHSRDEFIRNAHQMGLTANQAQLLANKYFAIPKHVPTSVTLDIGNAQTKLNNFIQTPRTIQIYGHVNPVYASGSGAKLFAGGGWITGSGGPTSDNQSIQASPGEFVVNAAAARANGPLLEAMNGGGRHTGSGYYSGGFVPSAGRGAGGATVIINVQGSIIGSDARANAVWLKDLITAGPRLGVKVV